MTARSDEASSPQAAMPQSRSGQDVVISRLIAAPRALVFKAWTDPDHLRHWWGPRDFTIPVCEIDPRPNGTYRLVMRAPDGTDYPMSGIVLAVVEPERIVWTIALEDHPPQWHAQLARLREKNGAGPPLHQPVMTATFEEAAGGTRLTITTRFESVAERNAFAEMGMVAGWNESLDRLEAEMRRMQEQ